MIRPGESEIELTADGSPTVFLPALNERYHSTYGALSESNHVYIDSGLKFRAAMSKDVIKVFELGFGTGLNAVLAAMTGIPIRYTAIEKHPLDDSVTSRLDFGETVDKDLFARLHSLPWNRPEALKAEFILHKISGDFTEYECDETFDVIFMDAFAPEKQPELWTENVIAKLSAMLSAGGVLTTYCSKGRIRRSFESHGLKSERLAGPPGGKREILRLVKPN